MCQFCVEHGEGKRWYLNAKNYAHDLTSDLRRREYMVEFVADFAATRDEAIGWMERLAKAPAMLEKAGKEAMSKRMQSRHFGQPVPIEECAKIFDLCTSITVIPCICRRHEHGGKGDPVCLMITTQPIESVLTESYAGYENGPEAKDFQRLTKDEAMALLARCEEKGLMHSVWTFHTPFTAAICNCDMGSGCMAMKLTKGYGMKLMWRGEFIAQSDAKACTSCGECAKVCPFGAVGEVDHKFAPKTTECWGCGVCRAHCPVTAIRLVERKTVPEAAAIW